MKIGCPNHPRKNLLDEIAWVGDHGFDYLDLFIEPESATPENLAVDTVAQLLADYHLGIVGHTAWYLPIGSPIRALRQAAIDEAARTFGPLQALGARFVTIHGNWASQKLFSDEEAIAFQVESLRILVERAIGHNLAIMYEPIPNPRDSIATTRALLDAVPGLKLHIDIGHANLYGKDPADYIAALHNDLVHIHLHDNKGADDLHLPMGCGNIDWEKTVGTLKKVYDGTVTLEIFASDLDYVLLCKEKFLKLWRKL
jgi:sugar phosphate isomerase/epimerase